MSAPEPCAGEGLYSSLTTASHPSTRNIRFQATWSACRIPDTRPARHAPERRANASRGAAVVAAGIRACDSLHRDHGTIVSVAQGRVAAVLAAIARKRTTPSQVAAA